MALHIGSTRPVRGKAFCCVFALTCVTFWIMTRSLHGPDKTYFTFHQQPTTNESDAPFGAGKSQRLKDRRTEGKYILLCGLRLRPIMENLQIVLKEDNFVEVFDFNKDWNVAWPCYIYTSTFNKAAKKLQEHQKLGQFPGLQPLVEKDKLSLEYTPKTFTVPMDNKALLKYILDQPEKQFLRKSTFHRGIEMLGSNFSQRIHTIPYNKKFLVQEYLSNPFLVENHKFDVGIFAAITSFNPLRIFIYEEEIIMRLCLEPYHPFDPEQTEKYIVYHGFEFDLLQETPKISNVYQDLNYSAKLLLFHYLEHKNISADATWNRFRQIIVDLFLRNKKHMALAFLNKYRQKGCFFELVRFDFALDAEGRVILMEVNRGPQMASKVVRRKQLMYQKIFRDTFRLVGTLEGQSNPPLEGENCAPCSGGNFCNEDACTFCPACLNKEQVRFLNQASREDSNLGGFLRAYPQPLKTLGEARGGEVPSKDFDDMHDSDKLMHLWYTQQ